MAQMVKNLPAIWETWVQSLGWEDPLEKGMATHSSILAWRLPWTEDLAGYSSWGRKESDITEPLLLSFFLEVSLPYMDTDGSKLGIQAGKLLMVSLPPSSCGTN